MNDLNRDNDFKRGIPKVSKELMKQIKNTPPPDEEKERRRLKQLEEDYMKSNERNKL